MQSRQSEEKKVSIRYDEFLARILSRKTDYYLTIDNPEPKNAKEKFFGLFSNSGHSGRLRAQSYQKNVIDQLPESELLQTVLHDVFFDAALSRSTVYRKRILEGLCEHYHFSNSVINHRAKTLQAQWGRLSAEGAVDLSKSFEYCQIEAMENMLRPELNAMQKSLKVYQNFVNSDGL